MARTKDRVTAVRLRVTGMTNAHVQLSRDLEQVRNEAISIANECGNGLLWIERVEVATQAVVDPDQLLTRDDPVGEVAKMIAALRQDPGSLISCASIVELQKKLPTELREGTNDLAFDIETMTVALDEAEGLLLSRLTSLEGA